MHIGLALLIVVGGCSDGDGGFNGFFPVPPTQLVIEGSIPWLNDGSRDVGYPIDKIRFNVASGGTVKIDALSAGVFAPSMDTQIFLATDDGSLDVGDFLYVNDDGDLGEDGSILNLDSYLQVELEPGDYLLFIAPCCYSGEEAIASYRLVTGSDPLPVLSEGNVNGNYQITISGDVVLN